LGDPNKVSGIDMVNFPVEQAQTPSMLRGSGMIEAIDYPSTSPASKLAPGALGLASTAAVGLYLYKKKHNNN